MNNNLYPTEYGTANFRKPDYSLCCAVVFGRQTRMFWQCHRPRITGEQNSYCAYHQRLIEAEERENEIMIAVEEDGDEILYLPKSCVKCSSDAPLVMSLETRDWHCPDCGASYGSDDGM